MKRLFLIALSLGTISFAPACASRDYAAPGPALPPEAGARGGVVAVSHPLAAAAGAKMLREGGNAIDAAAAIQFALNVVEPEFSGIGGGGFMMVHLAQGKGQTFVVEGREKAPAKASTTLFVEPSSGCNQDFGVASTSGQAVGVPGTLMVVATAVQRYGRKHLAEVMAPAIDLAERGFPVNFVLAADATSSRTDLYEATREVFRPRNAAGVREPVKEGYLLRQPDLAKTLKLIAKKGPEALYQGEIGAALVEAAQTSYRRDVPITDCKGQKVTVNGKPGLMTRQDLADYNIVIREPTIGNYRGYTIAAMSPPSSGGLTMIQALKMIERFPLGDASAGFGSGKANTLHVMTEAMRLAFLDRAAWMGDEDFVPVPKRGLLDPSYVDMRADKISLAKRHTGETFGDPWPYETAARPGKTLFASAEPVSYPGGYTTHFSVVDHWGNIVSYTTTIEAGWGTGIMVPGYGFMLNNELTDFNFGFNEHPRFKGSPGANDVQGGKRPRSSMTPSILFKGKEPIVAFGSPGGATIISSVYNVLINLVDHGMTLKDAIEAPRISITSQTTIAREAGFDEAEITKLRNLGHGIGNPAPIGNVNAVFIDLKTGRQYGAVDSTREGGLVAIPTPGNGHGVGGNPQK